MSHEPAAAIDVSSFYGSMLKIDTDGSLYTCTVYSEDTLPAGFTQIGTSNSYERLEGETRVSVIKPYIEDATYSGGFAPIPMTWENGGIGDITTEEGRKHQFVNATDPSNTYSRWYCTVGGAPAINNVISMPNENDYSIIFSEGTNGGTELTITRQT